MFYSDPSMKNTGLFDNAKKASVVKTNASGAFPKIWPDDEPALRKSTSSKLAKGDKVRLKDAPAVVGVVMGVDNTVAAVQWEGASLGLHRLANLIPA
jgi:hypothetical protein